MPSSFAHYAIGAVVVTFLGLRGRDRAKAGLWAVAPDLDVITAVLWFLLAPVLPLDASSLITGMHLLTHRGFSHSLLIVPLVVAGVWRWGGGRRMAVAAGAAWSSHIVLDLFTPWRVVPWWPISAGEVHWPTFTGLDPLLTLASIVATFLLLVELRLAERIGRLRERLPRWRGWASRHTESALMATLASLVLAAVVLQATAWEAGVGRGDVHPHGTPRSLVAVEEAGFWRVEERWHPWDTPTVHTIPRINASEDVPDAAALVALASCTMARLGPYGFVDRPAWQVQPGEEGTAIVKATDVVRNATGEGGPVIEFVVREGEVEAVRLGDRGRFALRVPAPVVEAAACR